MNDIVVLGHARFIEIDMARLYALKQRVLNVVRDVPGFISATLWEQHDDPFSFLTVAHYRNEEDSFLAFEHLVRSPVIEVIQDILSEPPDILRFRVLHQSGRRLEEIPVNEFMSVSKRIADPGMSNDLIDELRTIFEELMVIPGFHGSLIGQLTEVEEEILGMVFWETKAAWQQSMPKNTMYRVVLYQRVL